jgi:hypothetical protein
MRSGCFLRRISTKHTWAYNVALLLLLLQELCEEVFTKVERLFLLGLRAADPVRRARFFSLYHKHIPAGLFERLQFIICVQVRHDKQEY